MNATKLTKAELLTIIDDIDKTIDDINHCRLAIDADIIEVTAELNQSNEELNQLREIAQLSDLSLLEANTQRSLYGEEYNAIVKAEVQFTEFEAKAKIAKALAFAFDEAEAIAKAIAKAIAVAAEKAKLAKYDVKLNDMFGKYHLAVVGNGEKYMLSALDISGKFITRWNDPIEVSGITAPDGIRFSSKELRELNVVPEESVHKSV